MKTQLKKKAKRELRYPFQIVIQWNFCSADDHKNLINILSDLKFGQLFFS